MHKKGTLFKTNYTVVSFTIFKIIHCSHDNSLQGKNNIKRY